MLVKVKAIHFEHAYFGQVRVLEEVHHHKLHVEHSTHCQPKVRT